MNTDTASVIADDAAAYAADVVDPASESNILARITNLAREARQAAEDVAKAEEALKAAQDRYRILTELQLPEAMDEAQQDKLRTLDGYEVERGETLRASISKENMKAAVMWLHAHNLGSIVKRNVTLAFGKGEDQRAAEAADLLRSNMFLPSDTYSVNPQTLSATVRELVQEGGEVDMRLLGVHVQPFVKIKLAKEPKKKIVGKKA